MPGRNPKEAWRNFVDPLARAIGAVDMAIRLKEKRFADSSIITTSVPGVLLQRQSGPDLHLFMSMNLKAIEDAANGPWRMTTLRYDFELLERGQTLFGWHWHPVSKRSPAKWPHFHPPQGTPFGTRHVPSGRVALEDILMFAIDDLGVRPAYPTGKDTLEQIASVHKRNRSWA